MTFEAATAHEGPLVAAWDYEDNGQTRMCLFHVGGEHVTQLAETNVPTETREDFVDRLVAKNIRIGGMYAGTVYVWVVDEAGFTVWSGDAVAASGTRASKDVVKVTLFVDPAYDGHRGVRFTLASGASEVVVEEDDPIPRIDPAYGADELFLDTLWANYLGNQLAVWLLVPFVNERRSGSNEMDLTVARAARTLADQLDGSGRGELLVSMGAVGRSADLAFRVDAAQTAIDLRITLQGGETATVALKRGTRAQLAAFLRRVTTPSTVLSAMNTQIQRHKVESAP